MKITAQQMIEAVAKHSGNDSCREKCQAIIDGRTTIEEELRYSGSFLTYVFKGEYFNAYQAADRYNRVALDTLTDPKIK